MKAPSPTPYTGWWIAIRMPFAISEVRPLVALFSPALVLCSRWLRTGPAEKPTERTTCST